MENFDDYENKSYVQARRVKYELSDHLRFIKNFVIVVFQVLAVCIPETFFNFLKLFQASKPKDISGQVVLVTGGANGLGRAIASRLAKEKCKIVIADLNLNEAQKTALELAEKFNVETAAFKIDVSDFDAIQQLKIDIESSMGSVDILVNNAGIISGISLHEGQPSDIQKVIDVNLSSHFWVIYFHSSVSHL